MRALPLEQAEAIAKWIAAEGSGPVLWVLEDLLARATVCLDPLKGKLQVLDMKVEVNGSPVALVATPVGRRL